MADLFVSYRYWHPGHREYRFESSVIARNDLATHAEVNLVGTRPDLRKIEEYLKTVVCIDPVILYWRRME